MVRRTILPRKSTPEEVEVLVQKARSETGVERILVVYESEAARVYVEKEPPPRKHGARA